MNKQKVYRAGLMTPSTDAGGANASHAVTAAADAVRMGTHLPSRMGSLFAAPTLEGSVRWVRGNHMCRFETRLREITLDADTTYVFSVDAWEHASWSMRGAPEDRARAYWDTAITLTDWLARAETEHLDGTEWEVVFPADAVLSVRNVSAARLLAATDTDHLTEVKQITRGWAREDRDRRAA